MRSKTLAQCGAEARRGGLVTAAALRVRFLDISAVRPELALLPHAKCTRESVCWAFFFFSFIRKWLPLAPTHARWYSKISVSPSMYAIKDH